jgi:hypothetical protein
MLAPPLLAFGFANLAILGWLAAAAAPLVIHLWSRHRHREAPWAAMQFLLAAMRKNARRLQLQQWLLLAVRTLIIVLVVLAAAEPYGDRILAGHSDSPAHKVLVIDGSYSMAYRDNGASRFSQAKQLAAEMVRGSGAADAFTVILMAAPAKTIVGPAVADQVAAEIESLTQSHTGADLGGTLTLVEEAIAKSMDRSEASRRQEVHFFTDLQSITWNTHAGSHAERGNEDAIRNRLAAIAKKSALFISNIGQPRSPNLAITNLATSQPLLVVNRETTFEVALRQYGDEPRRQCAVEFAVDELPVGEQTVDVPAGNETVVRFTHRFQSAGSHTVAARAARDALSVDDVRWLVVPVREEARVLCVEGRAGEARHVASALNPGGDSVIRPVVVSESELAELDLANFDCLFLCNVAQLTVNEADRLRSYAAGGGGIVTFLGDRVIPESYNALAEGRQPLVPARLVELVGQPQFGLDPLDYRHPIVAPFRGRERAGLLSTPVSTYYRLELPENWRDIEIAAAMPNGDPFIVTAHVARGRAVLVATAGSLESIDSTPGEPWTNWPTWPSFLPLVREMLSYAMSGRQAQFQQSVGTTLGGALPSAPPAKLDPAALQIERPDGRMESVSLSPPAIDRQWSYGPTDVSGIHSLRGLPEGEIQQFAVNVQTAESDLAKIDAQQLPSELSLQDTVEPNRDAVLSTSQAGWERSLLWCGFVLLLVESFLAWQFGRGAL